MHCLCHVSEYNILPMQYKKSVQVMQEFAWPDIVCYIRHIMKKLRIALVHDWLTGMRGGEKCLEVLCELFPDAPL